MPELEKQSSNRVSTGTLTKYTFPSSSLGGLTTSLNVFVPGSASSSQPAPVLLYLAGLTCNEDTGAQKGGFLNTAGEEGLAVVFPDTSPRGANVPGEDDDWQLGTGRSARTASGVVYLELRGVCRRRLLHQCDGQEVGEVQDVRPGDEGDPRGAQGRGPGTGA